MRVATPPAAGATVSSKAGAAGTFLAGRGADHDGEAAGPGSRLLSGTDRSKLEPFGMASVPHRRQGGGMCSRPLFRISAALATGFALAGCAAYQSGMGPDPLSHSEAQAMTWSDGAPAVTIQCLEPIGCGQRAKAICMPRAVRVLKRDLRPEENGGPGAGSVVVRCD